MKIRGLKRPFEGGESGAESATMTEIHPHEGGIAGWLGSGEGDVRRQRLKREMILL